MEMRDVRCKDMSREEGWKSADRLAAREDGAEVRRELPHIRRETSVAAEDMTSTVLRCLQPQASYIE